MDVTLFLRPLSSDGNILMLMMLSDSPRPATLLAVQGMYTIGSVSVDAGFVVLRRASLEQKLELALGRSASSSPGRPRSLDDACGVAWGGGGTRGLEVSMDGGFW